MNPVQRKQLASAVVLALSRVDLPRCEQIEILEEAVEWLRMTEEVDEAALLQLVGAEEAN